MGIGAVSFDTIQTYLQFNGMHLYSAQLSTSVVSLASVKTMLAIHRHGAAVRCKLKMADKMAARTLIRLHAI